MPKSNEEAVLIGWAARDVTPERPVNLRGQFHMRISKGVNDPITATALAISSADEAIVFLSCDLVAIMDHTVDLIRQALRGKIPDLDGRKIILNATHTHTAPNMCDGIYPPVPDGVMTPHEYSEVFVKGAVEAIEEAWRGRKPGGVSWALATAVVGHNRRATYFEDIGARTSGQTLGMFTDGQTRMYGDTNDPRFSHIEGYEDHYVNLLYTWDVSKNLTGVVVNLACPSQETENEYYVSADFWHEIRHEIRRRHGEGVHVLGQCSAAGDQSPHLLLYKQAEARMLELRGLSMRQEIGRRVANAVDDVLLFAAADIRTAVPLAHVVRDIELPMRIITDDEAQTVRDDLAALQAEEAAADDERKKKLFTLIQRCKRAIDRHERQKDGSRFEMMEMHVARVGDAAFATNRFELFLDFGMRIKARSPAVQTFLIQLAGQGTYLPTQRAVAGKGYGSGLYDMIAGPQAGQTIVDETVKLLGELWA